MRRFRDGRTRRRRRRIIRRDRMMGITTGAEELIICFSQR
jgi:hypothetical protein